jgi:predicted ABC-type ATPase
MPQLWIVAGPNGAGKTTIADLWLASRIPVISPDNLAATQGISPMQAGRAAVLEQERLLSSGISFAVDTTFSGHRELDLMRSNSHSGPRLYLSEQS